MKDRDFDELWAEREIATVGHFDPSMLAGLPEPAHRYLAHAIAPGATLATAVRLKMHGEIKLREQWHPFAAKQVIRWQRGFLWRARVTMKGLPITGSDCWIDGEGEMCWKLLGLVPLITAEGPDITRSALGRVQIESVWLPTVLLGPDTTWSSAHESHVGLDLQMAHHAAHLELTVGRAGELRAVRLSRWGDPEERHEYHEHPFGGLAFEERTFDGITIPTRLSIGWYIGTNRFEAEGEFFRATIDHAEFR